MNVMYPVPAETERSRAAISQGSSLAHLFAEVCDRHGSRVAITMADREMTYAELDRLSSHICAGLQHLGARPGTIVAICLERSIEMIVAMLAVVKSGAAYLPLDTCYPSARLTETIADAAPIAVITSRELASRLEGAAAKVITVDALQSEEPSIASFAAPAEIHADDAAYVIYTSGSTGRPKGVLVSHRNVTRLITETRIWFHLTHRDVWTMFHSFAFDFSVWEIWGCLLSGGRLVIVPFALSRSPEEFHSLLVNERVTVLNQTPSAFVLLSQIDARVPTAKLALRYVIFGGEALAPGSLRGWFSRHGETQPELINMYGITETTVHVTYRRMLAADAEHECESVIGEPIPDMQIHLLDDALQPVPQGEQGEMWIGGSGVAKGYLNRASLTAERFVADPFGLPGAKLYRTGDLARRREDGELIYLGRRDNQVKINGYRIELGEVEAAVMAHPAIVQVCVIAHAESTGSARLAAYYVAKDEPEPAVRELSEFLAQRLPAQMMPAFYIGLPAFPLTPNGKIDRRALPAPQAGSTASAERKSLTHATGLEYRIAKIWQMVLKAEDVSLDDNFFDVGGTSLLLIAVRTGIEEQLDRPIPVTWMFEYTTIRSLAGKLSAPEVNNLQAMESRQENARKQRAAFARVRASRGIAS